MTTCKLHQIYYSPESYKVLDPGFIALDNSQGRQDWMEYWPIRQYFLNTPVDEDELVGFFSPRFFEKTGMTAADVKAHINANPGQDVYLFNPYFHLASWHQNLFVQASRTHQGIGQVFNEVLALLDIHTDVDQSVMSSMDTVYCNYFVAKLDFWKKWLMVSEFIYQLAEENSHAIGRTLRDDTNYHRGQMPLKIFVIERVASYLINQLKIEKVLPKIISKDMQYYSNREIGIVEILKNLDKNKTMFQQTNEIKFLEKFIKEKNFYTNEYGLLI